MAFDLPDRVNAAFDAQARLFSNDLATLAQPWSLTGIKSGCAVTAQGSPNMTLAVAAGVAYFLGTEVTVNAGNVTITTAHATWPRIDIVVVNSSGVKSVVAGTAAAAPLEPATPASSVMLAQVYVPATDTAIGSTQIKDRRIIVVIPAVIGARFTVRKTVNETLANSTTLQADDQLKFTMAANTRYKFKLSAGGLCTPTGCVVKFDWTKPAGSTIRWSSGLTSAAQSVMTMTAPSTGDGGHVAFEGVVINAATVGDLQLMWAFNASVVGATLSMLANSYLEYEAF